MKLSHKFHLYFIKTVSLQWRYTCFLSSSSLTTPSFQGTPTYKWSFCYTNGHRQIVPRGLNRLNRNFKHKLESNNPFYSQRQCWCRRILHFSCNPHCLCSMTKLSFSKTKSKLKFKMFGFGPSAKTRSPKWIIKAPKYNFFKVFSVDQVSPPYSWGTRPGVRQHPIYVGAQGPMLRRRNEEILRFPKQFLVFPNRE